MCQRDEEEERGGCYGNRRRVRLCFSRMRKREEFVWRGIGRVRWCFSRMRKWEEMVIMEIEGERGCTTFQQDEEEGSGDYGNRRRERLCFSEMRKREKVVVMEMERKEKDG